MKTANPLLGPVQYVQAGECLKVLAHPHRLKIADLLILHRLTVGELAERCEISQNVASGHLRLMQRCGFIVPERDGRNVFYRIHDPCLKKIMACIRDRFSRDS